VQARLNELATQLEALRASREGEQRALANALSRLTAAEAHSSGLVNEIDIVLTREAAALRDRDASVRALLDERAARAAAATTITPADGTPAAVDDASGKLAVAMLERTRLAEQLASERAARENVVRQLGDANARVSELQADVLQHAAAQRELRAELADVQSALSSARQQSQQTQSRAATDADAQKLAMSQMMLDNARRTAGVGECVYVRVYVPRDTVLTICLANDELRQLYFYSLSIQTKMSLGANAAQVSVDELFELVNKQNVPVASWPAFVREKLST
jgi:chromosome segregation ATPase